MCLHFYPVQMHFYKLFFLLLLWPQSCYRTPVLQYIHIFLEIVASLGKSATSGFCALAGTAYPSLAAFRHVPCATHFCRPSAFLLLISSKAPETALPGHPVPRGFLWPPPGSLHPVARPRSRLLFPSQDWARQRPPPSPPDLGGEARLL